MSEHCAFCDARIDSIGGDDAVVVRGELFCCADHAIRNKTLRNDPCVELMGKPYTELSPVEQVSWLSGLSVEEINRLGGMPEADNE